MGVFGGVVFGVVGIVGVVVFGVILVGIAFLIIAVQRVFKIFKPVASWTPATTVVRHLSSTMRMTVEDLQSGTVIGVLHDGEKCWIGFWKSRWLL